MCLPLTDAILVKVVLGAAREEGEARKGGNGEHKVAQAAMLDAACRSVVVEWRDGGWNVESGFVEDGRRARGWSSGNKWLLASNTTAAAAWSFRRGTVGLRLHRDYVTCSRLLEPVPLCPAFSPPKDSARCQG